MSLQYINYIQVHVHCETILHINSTWIRYKPLHEEMVFLTQETTPRNLSELDHVELMNRNSCRYDYIVSHHGGFPLQESLLEQSVEYIGPTRIMICAYARIGSHMLTEVHLQTNSARSVDSLSLVCACCLPWLDTYLGVGNFTKCNGMLYLFFHHGGTWQKTRIMMISCVLYTKDKSCTNGCTKFMLNTVQRRATS